MSISLDPIAYLEQIISESIDIDNKNLIQKISCQYLVNEGILKKNLTLNTARKFDTNFIYCSGSLNLFDKKSSEMSPVEKFLSYLFSNTPILDAVSKKILEAAFRKKDPTLLKEAIEVLQQIFHKIFQQLLSADKNNERLLERAVSLAMSLVPYFEPEDGTILHIPHKIGGYWVEGEYSIERIKLSSDFLCSNMLAYGFIPLTEGARPLVSFMGTPQPTTTGALLAYFIDFIPFLGIGEGLYLSAKKTVQDYFSKNSKLGIFKVYGMSLGGAMALNAKAHQPELMEVFALNSPGLSSRVLRVYNQRVKNIAVPKIHLLSHDNDLVAKIGFFPKDSIYYKVLFSKETNPVHAHIKPLNTEQECAIVISDIDKENRLVSRYLMTFAHFVVSWPLFIINIVMISGACFYNLFTIFARKAYNSISLKG